MSLDRNSVLQTAAAALLLISLGWLAALAGHPRYVAEARVMAMPYAPALRTPAFERQALQSLPGVLRLETDPAWSGGARPSKAARPNALRIRIIAAGSTAQDAESTANVAAIRLSSAGLARYGTRGTVVGIAISARGYSLLRDSFGPALAGRFSH